MRITNAGGAVMELEKLREIIANVLGVDVSEIKPETTFTEELGADSIDLYQIVMAIEDEFDIKIDTEVADKIQTVGDALELLKKAVG